MPSPRSVAAFHDRVARAGPESAFGEPREILAEAVENFTQLEPLDEEGDTRETRQALCSWTLSEFNRLEEAFARRKREGFVRECHGDLHLGNVALLDGKPVAFDAIEFNEAFRWIDVVNEVAFPVMDLFHHGLPALAHRFIDAWLDATGDFAGLRVLRFYLVYRAMVRAKVSCIRAHQPGIDVAERERSARAYRGHLELAVRFSWPGVPALIVMHGLSGSGKTTVSRALVEALGAMRLRSDVERKRLHGLEAGARTAFRARGRPLHAGGRPDDLRAARGAGGRDPRRRISRDRGRGLPQASLARDVPRVRPRAVRALRAGGVRGAGRDLALRASSIANARARMPPKPASRCSSARSSGWNRWRWTSSKTPSSSIRPHPKTRRPSRKASPRGWAWRPEAFAGSRPAQSGVPRAFARRLHPGAIALAFLKGDCMEGGSVVAFASPLSPQNRQLPVSIFRELTVPRILRSYAFAALLPAVGLAWAATPLESADPLLAIDLNRSAIITDIVKGFEANAESDGAMRLKAKLEMLRADRLLAASLASSRTSLDAILAEAQAREPAAFAQVREKALGDANRDLVYTPIVPCKIIDTYFSPIGRLPGPSTTAFEAIAADYAPQGGLNACATALPANMAAIAAQIAVVSPSNEGWLNLWPVGQPIPNNVTLGYYRDQMGNLPNVTTGSAVVPLCTSACAGNKEFNVYTASEAVVSVSVVGYFAPPLSYTPGGGTVTSITASTGLTGGTITSAGTIAVDLSYQLPQKCSHGQVATSDGAGLWNCVTPAVGGTVTSVATGTGLTGGPITGAGTVSVANLGIGTAQLADSAVTFAKLADGSVGSTKLANGSVGRNQVDSYSVQLRLSSICSRGVPLIGINQDGSPICDNPARTLPYTTNRTSVAIRADGRPLLARDGGNLYDCADANCTTGTDINLNAGGDVAMALRGDGRPVIAVGTSSSQILVICGDATCTVGLRVVRTLDTGNIGVFSGIALRADNTPLVSYFEFTTGQTRLYVCNDPTCASGTIRTITASPSFTPSGLRIRPNGSPMIALRDYFGGGHGLYDCNDATCSSGTIRGLGSGSSIRFMLGLGIRGDNRAIVVNSGPVMHDCADASCSSNVARPFDTGEFVTASAAAVRSDGRPLLAYGTSYGGVKLFDCADAACTSGTVRVIDQVAGSFSDQEIAMALRADGRAVIAYPVGFGGVRLLLCQSATCQ